MSTRQLARTRGAGVARLMGVVWGDDAHQHDARAASRRRRTLVAVLGISAVSALISVVHAFAIPPFQPPDETAHVAYALLVADGELPRIETFPDTSRIPHMREGLSVWTANHPPLLYALLSVPLQLADAVGAPLAGLYAARLAMVVSAFIGYLLVGWFALLLLPGREGAAVAATGMAALVPNHLHIAGMVYSDAFGFAIVTALLVAALVVLQRGVTTSRLVVLTVLAMVAANTRVQGLAAAAGCIACLGLAELLHGRTGWGARLWRGAVMVAASSLVTLLSSLWFYALNWLRYASPTGSAALMALHDRSPNEGTIWEWVVSPVYLRSLGTQLWQRVETDALAEPYLPDLLAFVGRRAVVVIAALAVLAGLWRLAGGAWRDRLPLMASWAVAVGWLAALYVAMTDFVLGGGGSHIRYLWPGVGTMAVIAAVGLTTLPRRLAPAAVTAFAGLQALAVAIIAVGLVQRPDVPGAVEGLRALAAHAPGAAVAVLVAVGVVGLLGLGVWAVTLWRLLPHDHRPPRWAAEPTGPVSLPAPGGRVRVAPLDVVLAGLAGTAAAWVAAYTSGVPISLPLTLVVMLLAAATVSALPDLRAHRRST